jgi:hypothetical protein
MNLRLHRYALLAIRALRFLRLGVQDAMSLRPCLRLHRHVLPVIRVLRFLRLDVQDVMNLQIRRLTMTSIFSQ